MAEAIREGLGLSFLTLWHNGNNLETMSPIVRQLAEKLDKWEPEISQRVETLVAEIMDLADAGALDLLRSRTVEQEVLGVFRDCARKTWPLSGQLAESGKLRAVL